VTTFFFAWPDDSAIAWRAMATSMQAHEGHAIYSPSGELSNFLAGPDHKWQGLGPALCIAGAATGVTPRKILQFFFTVGEF
jgi:hypothetical protein